MRFRTSSETSLDAQHALDAPKESDPTSAKAQARLSCPQPAPQFCPHLAPFSSQAKRPLTATWHVSMGHKAYRGLWQGRAQGCPGCAPGQMHS